MFICKYTFKGSLFYIVKLAALHYFRFTLTVSAYNLQHTVSFIACHLSTSIRSHLSSNKLLPREWCTPMLPWRHLSAWLCRAGSWIQQMIDSQTLKGLVSSACAEASLKDVMMICVKSVIWKSVRRATVERLCLLLTSLVSLFCQRITIAFFRSSVFKSCSENNAADFSTVWIDF